ncbi:Fc.00g034740.m01.CDS01 [Cosmosporella sp. VM-42]
MLSLPPRSPDRQAFRSPYWSTRYKSFIIPVVMVGVILQLLFLGNISYLYGSVYKSSSRAHALKVLAVDYDGAEIGESVAAAYKTLKGDEFVTLEYRSPDQYPTPDSLREAVCKEGYWGAIYSHAGASDRLMEAIEGNSTTEYNPSDTVSYIYNGIFYPIIGSSFIMPNLQTLITVASRVYYNVAGDARAAVNLTDPTSSAAYFNPIVATSSIIMPTTQGTRVFFNTVSMIMPILMQFFFLMASNGIQHEAGVFTNMSKRNVYLLRFVNSIVYNLVSSLCMTGYIWAFRETWSVQGHQFAETWMLLWFYMQIHYLVADTMLESVIPLKFFAFFLITWILTNISSTVYPFELSAGFYRWAYSLPAHNCWRVLTTILSGGCNSQLEVNLPVLFSWWVVGHLTSAWSVRKRCMVAAQSGEEKFLTFDEGKKAHDIASSENPESGLRRSLSENSRRTMTAETVDGSEMELNRLPGRNGEMSDSRTMINTGVDGMDGEPKI